MSSESENNHCRVFVCLVLPMKIIDSHTTKKKFEKKICVLSYPVITEGRCVWCVCEGEGWSVTFSEVKTS